MEMSPPCPRILTAAWSPKAPRIRRTTSRPCDGGETAPVSPVSPICAVFPRRPGVDAGKRLTRRFEPEFDRLSRSLFWGRWPVDSEAGEKPGVTLGLQAVSQPPATPTAQEIPGFPVFPKSGVKSAVQNAFWRQKSHLPSVIPNFYGVKPLLDGDYAYE